MATKLTLRIGTRESDLAMWQAKRVAKIINNKFSDITCSIVPIQTSGDINLTDAISDIGGKGIFLKEIELALLNNKIDIAVHSFKDITAVPQKQLVYSGFILEESVTDSFILFNNKQLDKDSLMIATGSLRRHALCKQLYPNVQCKNIRGNIGSRIKNAQSLGYDGVILSTAGLQRLNMTHLISKEMDPTIFIPAPGQGILAIQNRINDLAIQSVIEESIQPEIHELGRKYFKILSGINFNCGIPFGAFFDCENNLHIFIERNGCHFTKVLSSNLDSQLNDMIRLIKDDV